MARRNMVLLRDANGISPKIRNEGMCLGHAIYYDVCMGRGVCGMPCERRDAGVALERR